MAGSRIARYHRPEATVQSPLPNGKLTPPTPTTGENPDTVLEMFAEVADTVSQSVEEHPTFGHWMEIAAPIMKSGGKTVSVILALGFISIPLTLFGSPWIGIILATGANHASPKPDFPHPVKSQVERR